MVKSVRLACLMCAASVYPEPGSNSLVMVSILLSYLKDINHTKSFFQALFKSVVQALACYKWLIQKSLDFCIP